MSGPASGAAPGPPPFLLRYGISRTGDPDAPLLIEPCPEVCRGGILRPTVLAAAVDMVGSLFARGTAGRDRIRTIDLSVRAPARPVPKRIVARGELLRAGRSLIASAAVLEAEGKPLGYGQTTFLRVPPREGGAGGVEPVGLPEVLDRVPLERPIAEEAGVVVADGSRGRVELPLGPASLSPDGVMQGALVALLVEEAALALAEDADAGPHVVIELDVRYLAPGRKGPIVSSAQWVADRAGEMIRVALYDAGAGNRTTTAGLARVAEATAP